MGPLRGLLISGGSEARAHPGRIAEAPRPAATVVRNSRREDMALPCSLAVRAALRQRPLLESARARLKQRADAVRRGRMDRQAVTGFGPRAVARAARHPTSVPTTTVKAIQSVICGTRPIQNHLASAPICGKWGGPFS